MATFEGKWQVESTENFDEYMKALGVGMVMRKLGASTKPTLIISRNAETWKVRSESSVKNTEIEFQFGKEFDETTADGRKVKTTVTQDSPTKWTHVQKGEPPSTLVRELVDNNTMKLLLIAKDVTSTRIYKRDA